MVEGLTFLYNNIRSVSANLEGLEFLVAHFRPFVIALTETWWKIENDAELFRLEGYERLFASIRNRKRGNRRSDLEAELLHTDEAYELISVKISDFEKKKKIIVSCFYCEPSRSKIQYLEHVEGVLDKNGEGMQIACEDFHLDLLNETLAGRITLENLMTAQGLDLVSLREPTRETAA